MPLHTFVPIDATLGVPGLPQSGTGQAALFSGENAAVAHGAHFGPYPPTAVRPLLDAQSLYARLLRAGVGTGQLAFANAYPDRFFSAAEARGRWTTTTYMARSAGVRLRTAADLARGDALAADLTGAGWQRLLDPTLAPISEAEAAARLVGIARAHRFTLFEYYLTDKAGHSRDAARAAEVLNSVDRLFAALLDRLDPDLDLLVVSSDHGNLESLGTKSHTRHPVPLVAVGRGADRLARATSLLDVTPMLVSGMTGAL
jgi:phosphopentomutase